MAHYVAELIDKAEQADVADREAAEARCARAILDLWSHRAALSGRRGLFDNLAPVLETLRALHPDRHRAFYRSDLLERAVPADDDNRTWLDLARGIDFTARLLIEAVLARATERTLPKAIELADASREAGIDADIDIEIVTTLADDAANAARRDQRRREQLQERVDRLEAFLDAAGLLRSEFSSDLAGFEEDLATRNET